MVSSLWGKLVDPARHVLCLDPKDQSLVGVSPQIRPGVFVFFLGSETWELLSHAHLDTKHLWFRNDLATSVIVGRLLACQGAKNLARAQTA